MIELAVLGLLKGARCTATSCPASWVSRWVACGASRTARCTRRSGASSATARSSPRPATSAARRKKVYRITSSGEQLFLELLQEAPQDTQSRTRDSGCGWRSSGTPPETRIGCSSGVGRRYSSAWSRIAESLATGRAGADDYGRALVEHTRTSTESDIAWLERLIAAERAKTVLTEGS